MDEVFKEASDAMIRARNLLIETKCRLPKYINFEGNIFKVIKKPGREIELELMDQPNDK